ncbi:MAG: type III pantothenate kinase [Candidatus Loosdrechtia sp.]|uniref:type III pantothenate kinase n=1 Tax=Candidatus Loosdrechtia sp. TaxID=3101272 RepID=UPI003A63F7F5|nr:MAG: type III pantothenate kinase [Candidatus Jettenia sp. AMX2]WKZ22053.1 MAG: type III pantothenate kinase [Candidatus Jettenia sp. AMX2]
MLLAIDIGNTNVHTGIFVGDVLQFARSFRCEFDGVFQANFIKFLNSILPARLKAVVLSSVNPETETLIVECVERCFHMKPCCIGKDMPVPIPVVTDHPEKVGSDRLANAVAAFERTKGWAIIVDAGTAITIDVIDDKGAFLGGTIAPGVALSSKALHQYTAFLPDIFIHKPKNIIGKNTEEAISSGIYWGTVGMVENILSMLCDEINCKPAILATGGDATMLQQEIPFITEVIPELTLEGIMITYKIHSLPNKQLSPF